MHAVVVYESLWGNTAAVAHAIGEGIGPDTVVVSTAAATGEVLRGVDLIVAGAPVFAFHLSDERTRQSIASQPESGAPTPDLSHPSLRSWLADLPDGTTSFAAFDTQVRGPFGRGAPTIAKELRAKGYIQTAKPEGFIVAGKYGPLHSGELDRARAWGATLRGAMASA